MPTSMVGLGSGGRSTHFQVPSGPSSYSMCSCRTVMEPRVLGVAEGGEEGRGEGTWTAPGQITAGYGLRL